jgi:hypothetical protein
MSNCTKLLPNILQAQIYRHKSGPPLCSSDVLTGIEEKIAELSSDLWKLASDIHGMKSLSHKSFQTPTHTIT